MKFSRRHFLLAGGLLGGAAYINQRGLRYPRMGFEPLPLANRISHLDAEVDLHDLVFIGQDDGKHIDLRAYSLSPSVKIKVRRNQLKLNVNNIAESSGLEVRGTTQGSISEDIHGINRTISISNAKGAELELEWKLSNEDQIEFAVIGDTGGADELAWCLRRARQLNAKFLFHLGDFNYGPGEYASAIKQFHQSELPVFVSIGNHDFNDKGLVYETFRNELGPMNSNFTVAGTRFINVDSGADFFPPYSGNRGAMFKNMRQADDTFSDQLLFTHKPFVDSRLGEDHVISGIGESEWLLSCMKELGIERMLCGHVHRSTEIDYEGIQQITAGEGLGFEDIRSQQQVAKILMGRAEKGKKVVFDWQLLDMPWTSHTSPTHLKKLRRQGLNQQRQWYENLL